MIKRIVEEFRIGEGVEINLGDGNWLRAIVVYLDHPGIWVQDDLGRRWFVTNKKNIRRWADAS